MTTVINSTSLWYWLVLMLPQRRRALSAAAGSLDAAKEMVSAVADTTMSVGARAFQIALAAVGIGLAVASDIAALRRCGGCCAFSSGSRGCF